MDISGRPKCILSVMLNSNRFSLKKNSAPHGWQTVHNFVQKREDMNDLCRWHAEAHPEISEMQTLYGCYLLIQLDILLRVNAPEFNE